MATRPYPMPTNNDTGGFFEMFSYVNTNADNLFFPVMLLVLWGVIFMATKQFTASRAWTIASFVTAVLAIPLAVAQLIAPYYMYLSIILTVIGFVWLKLENSTG